MVGGYKGWIIRSTACNFGTITDRMIWVIAYIHKHIVYKYRITKRSHTNVFLSSVLKYSFKGFIRMQFKMTDTLFSIKINTSSLDAVTLTDKSLVFLLKAFTNSNSLPIIFSIFLCYIFWWIQFRYFLFLQFNGD